MFDDDKNLKNDYSLFGYTMDKSEEVLKTHGGRKDDDYSEFGAQYGEPAFADKVSNENDNSFGDYKVDTFTVKDTNEQVPEE